MVRSKRVRTFVGSMLLMAALAACADQPVSPNASSAGDGSLAASTAVGRGSPRDVPEVQIALPPAARPWDGDPAALQQAIAGGGGYAVVAFKEPGSGRALATGRRAAVTSGTVRAGLQLLERNGVEVVELLDAIGGAHVRIDPAAAAEISRHPLIDFVEPRQYGSLQAQTTPWGITMVGAPTFWSTYASTGAGAKVEIIDSGHQQNHVDLPAVPSVNCAGVYGGCDDASTTGWHGTHVLGIVTARNNTDGVVGVAPGIAPADVYMYGACDNSKVCPTDQVTAGINSGVWNVHVLNLSLSQPYDAAQATAIAQAWSNGIVIVAAAGNNLSNASVYPAAYPNVLGVSGVNSDKSFAASGTTGCTGYSNYGSHVDLAAPFSANSTIGISTYGVLCGTSMAAPHVTGVAALVKAKNPTWTNQQIVNHLTSTAEDRGAIGWDPYFGYGIVRAVTAPPPPSVYISGPSSITAAGTYTWTANPSGGNGTYTYQWQYRVQGSTTWTSLGTASTHSRTIAAGNVDFELQVTVTSGGATASDTHLVDVAIPPTITPLGVTITGPTYVYGGSSNTWTANPTGGNGTYTYQWQYSNSGSTWNNGVTTKTYTRLVGPYATALYLRVTVTSDGASVTSPTYHVQVEPQEIDQCGDPRYICQ